MVSGQVSCGGFHGDTHVKSHILYGDTVYIQVRRSDGAYIDVPYRPDAVLINLGAQMEHWTNKTYPATV